MIGSDGESFLRRPIGWSACSRGERAMDTKWEGEAMDKVSVMTSPARDTRLDTRPGLQPTPYKPTHEAIAKRAYELYEDSGRPGGRDVEFWLKAERELITER